MCSCLCPVLAWFGHWAGSRDGPVTEAGNREELAEGQASTEETNSFSLGRDWRLGRWLSGQSASLGV